MLALESPAKRKFAQFLTRNGFTAEEANEIRDGLSSQEAIPVPNFENEVDSVLQATNVLFRGNKPVRVIVREDSPWFVAKDVFASLELAWNGTRTLEKVPAEWTKVVNLTTLAATPTANFDKEIEVHTLNEPGVYMLAARSRKPAAVEFMKWVYETLLPQVRRGLPPPTVTVPITPLPTANPSRSTTPTPSKLPKPTLIHAKGSKWEDARSDTKQAAAELDRELARRGVENIKKGQIVNLIYKALFEKTAAELRESLGLTSWQQPLDQFGTEDLLRVHELQVKVIEVVKTSKAANSSLLFREVRDYLFPSE
jgi:prophage antirepressor-like protein